MIVLGIGESKDRKGAELEDLTRRLLGEMGYTNIVKNKIDSGGSEIDVSADHVVAGLGGDVRHRLVCECKAYKGPVGTDDWLKFLGKVYQEQSLLPQENVVGCLIALSGVNGPVSGSYDKLPQRGQNIRLVTGDTLNGLVKTTFGVADSGAVLSRVASLTDRILRDRELAYFTGKVHWVIFYDGEYTILDASGSCITPESAAPLRALVEAETAAGNFIDLQEEAKAKFRANLAEKAVLSTLIVGGGMAIDGLISEPYRGAVTEAEFQAAVANLKSVGWIDQGDSRTITFAKGTESTPSRLAEIYRLLVGGVIFPHVLGCPWYDDHINEALVEEACHIQQGVKLSIEEIQRSIQLMRWSPSALRWALVPEPMIVTHREQVGVMADHFNSEDRKLFLRALHRAFKMDFTRRELGEYFYRVRGLREVDIEQVIKVKSDKQVVLQEQVRERVIIGELAEQYGGGFLHMLGIDDAPEPWESQGPSDPPNAKVPGPTTDESGSK